MRLEDVIAAMESLAGLKKQARQAARYRSLSDRIRRSRRPCCISAGCRHRPTSKSPTLFADADEGVRTAMVAVTRATAGQAGAAEAVPPRAEAQAAAAPQRLNVARDGLQADRVDAARQDAERRGDQIRGDIDREQSLKADATGAVERLEEERAQLAADQAGGRGGSRCPYGLRHGSSPTRMKRPWPA